jgi:hypothetical protein
MAGTRTTTARNLGAATMTTKVICPTNPAMKEVTEEVTTAEGLGRIKMTLMTTKGINQVSRAMAAITVEEMTIVVDGRDTMIPTTTRKSSNQINPVTPGVGKTKMTPTMTIAGVPARNLTMMTRGVMVNLLRLDMANQVMANPVDMPRSMVVMIPLV